MSSSDYWRRREDEALKHRITDEKEYDKRIEQIYRDMLDNCQKEIDAFYGKYADKEGISIAEAKKRVSKLDIAEYERKAKRYVKDAELDRKANGGKTNKNGYYFSEKANEEMRLYNTTMKVNRLEMLKANIGLEMIKGHAELEAFMGEILAGRTEDELKRQAGILGKTVKSNAKKADAIVNASFHNATFSDRIWQYQDMMKADLSKLLQSGLIQGKNPRALAKDLKKYFIGDEKKVGGAAFNVERLMRTELARVQTEAQKQSFERNGFDYYEFLVNHGCCPICAGLNGKHFKVKDMMPGLNAPPMHPHCRCSTAAWSDDAEYEAWLDYLDKGGTTEEWNKLKAKSVKEKDLTNSVSGDNIELYRKGSTHRKTSPSGAKIIDKATYNKITKPAIKAGADIRIADAEWLERLKKKNASAVTIGDVIYFRPDATVSDVLEEVHHFYQNKKGLNNKYSVVQREIMNEIDAKKYLLSVAKKYKIPEEETDLTRRQLSNYIKDMENMKERGEWVD